MSFQGGPPNPWRSLVRLAGPKPSGRVKGAVRIPTFGQIQVVIPRRLDHQNTCHRAVPEPYWKGAPRQEESQEVQLEFFF